MNDKQIKDIVKKASEDLEPIIDLLGAHAEGLLPLSAEEASKCEKALREIVSQFNDVVFALATR